MRCTISWGQLASVYWLRDEDGIGRSKFILGSALECTYIYHASAFLRGRIHLVRDTAAENEFNIAI